MRDFRNIFLIIFCFYLSFLFCSCAKNTEYASADNTDLAITKKLEEIENVSMFEDETIKSLACIVESQENIETNIEYSPKDERIYKLVKETRKNPPKNKDKYKNLSLKKDKEDWVVVIRKFEILNFLAKNNISLTNISEIEPIFADDGTFESLVIGNNTIEYKTLAEEFGLKSNNITNIETTVSEIKIFGTKNNIVFDIEEANKLSKEGKNYKEILEFFQNKNTSN